MYSFLQAAGVKCINCFSIYCDIDEPFCRNVHSYQATLTPFCLRTWPTVRVMAVVWKIIDVQNKTGAFQRWILLVMVPQPTGMKANHCIMWDSAGLVSLLFDCAEKKCFFGVCAEILIFGEIFTSGAFWPPHTQTLNVTNKVPMGALPGAKLLRRSANGGPFWCKTVSNVGPKQAFRCLDLYLCRVKIVVS